MENGKGECEAEIKVKQASIPNRAFDFGVMIIRIGQLLYRRPNVPRRLIDQLVACGTSIGANVEEGQAAHSRADFIAKYGIALREARESVYRLRLFIASEVLTEAQAGDLLQEASELTRMLGRAVVTARSNQTKHSRPAPS